MNTFTKPEQFRDTPENILKNSDLLDPKDCKIINNVLYEKVQMEPSGYTYRFFFDVDDYDYVVDTEFKEFLDKFQWRSAEPTTIQIVDQWMNESFNAKFKDLHGQTMAYARADIDRHGHLGFSMLKLTKSNTIEQLRSSVVELFRRDTNERYKTFDMSCKEFSIIKGSRFSVKGPL